MRSWGTNYVGLHSRRAANITIYPDPDEPMSYEDGIQIGCNAPRVVAALKEAGFVIFKAASFKKRPSA